MNSADLPEFDDQYETLAFLGRGGMGTVYKAKEKALDRLVAIKVLHQSHWDTDTVRRFVREAQMLKSLQDARLVAVYKIALDPNGHTYMVMEFVDGFTLKDLIASGNPDQGLAWEDAVRIIIEVCKAAGVIHRAGIVHRDLKPENIMVVGSGENLSVKLMDFGIAKLLHSIDNVTLQKLTQTGHIVGSPIYMSPEQFMTADVDWRADIYALGCALYQSVTGQVPVAGENQMEVAYKVISGKVARLSQYRGPRRMPRGLEKIINRCLEKSPLDRYQSMQDLERALQVCLENGVHDEMIGGESGGDQSERSFNQRLSDSIERKSIELTRASWLTTAILSLLLLVMVVVGGGLLYRDRQQQITSDTAKEYDIFKKSSASAYQSYKEWTMLYGQNVPDKEQRIRQLIQSSQADSQVAWSAYQKLTNMQRDESVITPSELRTNAARTCLALASALDYYDPQRIEFLKRAIGFYAKLPSPGPDEKLAYRLLFEAYQRSGEHEKGLATIKDGLKLGDLETARKIDFLLLAGEACLATNQISEGKQYFTQARDLIKESDASGTNYRRAVLRAYEADLLAHDGNLPAAVDARVAAMEEMVESRPSGWDYSSRALSMIEALAKYGEKCLDTGDRPGAEKAFAAADAASRKLSLQSGSLGRLGKRLHEENPKSKQMQ